MTHVIERDGMSTLTFEGDKLATVSTKTGSKRRWTELEIYKTEGDQYVTVVVGKSDIPGEFTIRSAQVHETATLAVRSFAGRRGQRGCLSAPALDLLGAAGMIDHEIEAALDAVEDLVEHVD